MNIRPRSLYAGLALLALTLTACDSTNPLQETEPESPTLSAAVASLTEHAALSSEGTAAVQATFAAHEASEPTPGMLWHVAADLQDALSSDDRAKLTERLEHARNGQRPAHRARAPRRTFPKGDSLATYLPDLTPAQQEALAEIRSRYREQFSALREAHRADTGPPEAAREALRTLRTEMQAELDAVLTPTQRAAIEARKAERRQEMQERREARQARRTEARTAAADVLRLTSTQQDALRAMHASHRAESKALRRAVRAGASRDENAGAIRALHTERLEALESILTPEQLEVVRIHRALVAGMVQHRHHAPAVR